MNKTEILDTAKGLITGDRVKAYGTPASNFQRIATFWEPILKCKVTPAQVALCMLAVKITRLIETPEHEDSWVDAAGYAACGGEVAEPENKPTTPPPVVYPNMWGQESNYQGVIVHG